MEDILKPGAKLKARKVNLNDPKIKKQIQKVQQEIDEVLKSQKVDWEKLHRTYITI